MTTFWMVVLAPAIFAVTMSICTGSKVPLGILKVYMPWTWHRRGQ
jgi:hypothetical protein